MSPSFFPEVVMSVLLTMSVCPRARCSGIVLPGRLLHAPVALRLPASVRGAAAGAAAPQPAHLQPGPALPAPPLGGGRPRPSLPCGRGRCPRAALSAGGAVLQVPGEPVSGGLQTTSGLSPGEPASAGPERTTCPSAAGGHTDEPSVALGAGDRDRSSAAP